MVIQGVVDAKMSTWFLSFRWCGVNRPRRPDKLPYRSCASQLMMNFDLSFFGGQDRLVFFCLPSHAIPGSFVRIDLAGLPRKSDQGSGFVSKLTKTRIMIIH